MMAYLNYFKLRLITNLQYRSAALAGIFTQLFFAGLYIMLYLALYESNTGVNAPMDLNSLVSYMWLQQAFFAITYPFLKDNELLGMIKNGNLAYELIRPQNFFFKFYIKMLAERVVATLLRCLPIIIIGLLLPSPYKLCLPPTLGNFLVFMASLILSCLLVTALSLIVHIITMFTLDSRGITSPLWMKKISDYLPFKFIGDFPYRVYSGNISVLEGKTLLLGSFTWMIVAIIFGFILSKYALKKAVIQGG